MAKEISLRQQLLAEKKRLEMDILQEINPDKMNMSEILDILLPHYDQDKDGDGRIRAWHAATQTEKGIKGGVRSGKTYAMCAEAIGLAYINRPYTHLSLSPTFSLACDTVVTVLEQILDKEGYDYHFSKSSQTFKIYFGRKRSDVANILIYGAEQEFKGLTVASGDIQEPFSIAKRNMLIWWERISDVRAKINARLWGGTAEPDKMQWGWEYFKKKIMNTPKTYATTITTYDNRQYLPEGYIEELEEKYDTRMRRVYMLGQNINLAQGAVYYAFNNEKHVKPHHELMSIINAQTGKLTILLGFDFNVDPMTCAEFIIVGDKRLQVDEYKISNSNTAELCDLVINRLRSKYPDLEGSWSILITGDASGKAKKSSSAGMTDITIISQSFYSAGLEPDLIFEESNPPVRDRVNYVNKLFETERYLISDQCEHSIRDRELVVWKKGAEKFIIDKSKDDLTHLSEAGDYAMMLSKRMGIDTPGTGDEDHSGSSEVIQRERR